MTAHASDTIGPTGPTGPAAPVGSRKRSRRQIVAPDGVVAPFTLCGLAKLDAAGASKVQSILDDHADEYRMDDVVALCLYEEQAWIQFITHLVPDTKLGTQDTVPNSAGSTLFELLWEQVNDRALYERLMGWAVEDSNPVVDRGSPFYLNLNSPTSSRYDTSSWWEQWCRVLPKVCPKAASHAFPSRGGGTTCVVPFRYGLRRYVAVETCSRATYRNYIFTHVKRGYHASDSTVNGSSDGDDNDWTPCDAIITGTCLKGNYSINEEWYLSETAIAAQETLKQQAKKQRCDEELKVSADASSGTPSVQTTDVTHTTTEDHAERSDCITHCDESNAEDHEAGAGEEEEEPVWGLGDGCELNVSSEGELLFCMRLLQAPNASLHHALLC